LEYKLRPCKCADAVCATAIYGDSEEDVMKKTVSTGLVLVFCLGAGGFAVPKTQIWYSAEELAGGRWQYNYEVTNISLTPAIEEFTIWFGYGAYDNLVIETADPLASDWSEVVWHPEPVLLDDGGYDAKALGAGIKADPLDNTVSGFAVSFDWFGVGEPGPQFYEIIDPLTLETIDSGMTKLIPEPATLLLLGLGGLTLLRKRRTLR
jgi:hypothetical protein